MAETVRDWRVPGEPWGRCERAYKLKRTVNLGYLDFNADIAAYALEMFPTSERRRPAAQKLTRSRQDSVPVETGKRIGEMAPS